MYPGMPVIFKPSQVPQVSLISTNTPLTQTSHADKPSAISQCRNSTYFLGHTVVQAARLNAGLTGVILQWIWGGCWSVCATNALGEPT